MDFEEQIKRQKAEEEAKIRYSKINKLKYIENILFVIALYLGIVGQIILSVICFLGFVACWFYVLYLQYKSYKNDNKGFRFVFIGMATLLIVFIVIYLKFIIF